MNFSAADLLTRCRSRRTKTVWARQPTLGRLQQPCGRGQMNRTIASNQVTSGMLKRSAASRPTAAHPRRTCLDYVRPAWVRLVAIVARIAGAGGSRSGPGDPICGKKRGRLRVARVATVAGEPRRHSVSERIENRNNRNNRRAQGAKRRSGRALKRAPAGLVSAGPMVGRMVGRTDQPSLK